MWQKLKNKLKQIQESDNDVRKKRWLIGLSVITMILITGVWAVYLNHSIKNSKFGIDKKEKKSETVGFGDIIGEASDVLGGEAMEKIKNLNREILGRTIIIEE